MKLLLLYLLAALGAAATAADRSLERRKLREVLTELDHARQGLQQHSRQLLHTPPQDVEDCCCMAALQCYKTNMEVHFKGPSRNQVKLSRSLNHHLTARGLNFCHTGNTTTPCQACDLYPKEEAREFFNRLESLIQRALTRLSLD